MAAALLLPENGRKTPGLLYANASAAACTSACLVQGGGTPPALLRANVAVARPEAPGWSPANCKKNDTGGQGHSWDLWHIACICGGNHAAPHHDACPEIMMQWPPEARKELGYEHCRKLGTELCNLSISKGVARAWVVGGGALGWSTAS